MKDKLLVNFVLILVIAQLFGNKSGHKKDVCKVGMVKRSETSHFVVLGIFPQLTFKRRLKLEPTPKSYFKHLHIYDMPIDELEFIEMDQIKVYV